MKTTGIIKRALSQKQNKARAKAKIGRKAKSKTHRN